MNTSNPSSASAGSSVRLVPTEGGYQKEKQATLVSETVTEYRVRVSGESRVRRFRKTTMLHVSPSDREFPNYKLILPSSQPTPL